MIAELAIIVALAIASIWFLSARGRVQKVSIADPDLSLHVELADSLILRIKGLMGRKSMGDIDGMLFVFDRPGRYGLWMLNTRIPLEAIFFDEDGIAVDIIQMEPHSLKTHEPRADASFILEVERGFCQRHPIKVGKSLLRFDAH